MNVSAPPLINVQYAAMVTVNNSNICPPGARPWHRRSALTIGNFERTVCSDRLQRAGFNGEQPDAVPGEQ